MTNLFWRQYLCATETDEDVISDRTSKDYREENSIVVSHDGQHDEISEEELNKEEEHAEEILEL